MTRDAPESPLTTHEPGLDRDAAWERLTQLLCEDRKRGDICGSNSEWLSWDSDNWHYPIGDSPTQHRTALFKGSV